MIQVRRLDGASQAQRHGAELIVGHAKTARCG
jgi:hypothetical protein